MGVSGLAVCLVTCVQAELTDREFEKLLAQEEKQKVADKKKKQKQTKRDKYHGGPKSRILNRKRDRRSKAAMNNSKSDESGGDEVHFCLSLLAGLC